MARCSNDKLFRYVGGTKLDDHDDVEFRLRKDMFDCRKIDTRFVTSGVGTYNKYLKPGNAFECGRHGCTTSGTLMVAANGSVVFHDPNDATEYANGIVTFYVYKGEATLPATVTVTLSDSESFTNADTYTYTVTEVDSDGFAPVIIDLQATPTQVGDGWTASSAGTYIRITSTAALGYSSISIYDSIEDFAVEDVVKVSCLSTIGGTVDLSTIAEQCQEVTYDDNINTLSYSLTGTRVTPNYWKLNPLMEKGEAAVGSEPTEREITIAETTIDSVTYGLITLGDVNQDDCGGISVQLKTDCDSDVYMLQKLNIPTVLANLGEGYYQVIKKADGSTDIVFNAALIGQVVFVSYPKIVNIEERVATVDALDGVHVTMIDKIHYSDKSTVIRRFENVFITSFPATITNNAVDFSFTITIARDASGAFYHEQKLIA